MPSMPIQTNRAEPLKTALLAAALATLTASTRSGGAVATAEAQLCRPFGPAPRWARLASLLPERSTLGAVMLVTAANRVRTRRPVLAPAARPGGGVLARAVFASAVQRRRPQQSWWRAEPHGWSFPSRHTTHAVLIGATVADEFGPLPRSAWIVWVAGCGTLVGLSRLRLGVHWPRDVAGGALTAALWLRLTKDLA